MIRKSKPANGDLLIRNVDPTLRADLKERARQNRRSMSDEARETLRAAIARDNARPLPENFLEIAEGVFDDGRVDLELPDRHEKLEHPISDFIPPNWRRDSAG